MTTNRRPLTEREQRRAARAKAFWLEKKRRERLTQDDANTALGWSPSTFGQYINGRIPMNLEATLKIAEYLGVSPADISGADEVREDALNYWREFRRDGGDPDNADQRELQEKLVQTFMRNLENLNNDHLAQLIEAIGRTVSPRGAVALSRILLDSAQKSLPPDE